MEVKTDLRQYVAIVLHWAWLIILVAALAGAGTYFVTSQQPRIYQASTTILIDEAPGTKDASNYQSVLTSERRARTYAQLITAGPLLDGVIAKLGLPTSARTLKGAITVQSVRDTQLIKVQVRDTNPERAAQIGNTLVELFAQQTQQLQTSRYGASKESLQEQMTVLEQQIQQTEKNLSALSSTSADKAARDRLETGLAQYRQSYANLLQSFEAVRLAEAATRSSVVVAEPATSPQTPISPRVLLNTMLATIVGLLAALGLVFLKETLNDTVTHADEIAQQFGLPVLGHVAHISDVKGKPIVVAQPRSPVAEAFRALRSNIDFAGAGQPLRTLLITSASPGDGKTQVSVNLAAVIAQTGREVAVIDADLRRPMVHKRLDLSDQEGLSELFIQPQLDVSGAVRKTSIAGVSAITSGKLPPNPAELLRSNRMGKILEQVRNRAAVIVVDAPPVTAVTDAAVLAPRVDGVVLVARVGQTKLPALKHTVEQLQRAGANIIGVVLNDVPVGRSRYGYTYQNYYQQYASGDAISGKRKWFGRRKTRNMQAKA